MEPERTSPYWDAIVGDDWPAIAPAHWNALETRARAAADALNTGDAPQARLAFDQAVRASEGLQPIKDEMLAQQGVPQAFSDALLAASEVFRGFGELVYRTRNRILDIVDDATARITAVRRRAESDGGAGESDDAANKPTPEETEASIAAILGNARADVRDVVAAALASLSPSGVPALARIADILGQPGPWTPGRSGAPEPPPRRAPTSPEQDRVLPPPPAAAPPSPRGVPLPAPLPNPEASGPPPMPLEEAGDVIEQPPDSPMPIDLVTGPAPEPTTLPVESTDNVPHPDADPTPTGRDAPVSATPDAPVHAGPVGRGPAGQTATPWAAFVPDTTRGTTTSDPGVDRSNGPVDRIPEDGSDRLAGASPYRAAGSDEQRSEGESTRAKADVPDTDPAAERTDAVADAAIRAAGQKNPETDLAAETDAESEAADAAAMGAMPPPILPAGPPPAAVSATAPTSPPPPVTSKPAGTPAGAVAPQSSATPPAPPVAPAKAPVVGAQPPPGSSAPAIGTAPAASSNNQSATRTGTPAHEEHAEAADSGDMVRNVVGAAMAAAAGPSFVLGEKVDGDLVLARTLLAGVLAAAPHVVGHETAVAIMRHSGGVNAFLTTNEGRGWLPSGVFVPPELSTPWMWSVSDGSAWEGLSDPARVLAEFGVAWGRKSGARLTALASSLPIPPMLAAQLGDVATIGEVPASPEMDLSVRTGRLVDRLELTASPRMLARVAAIPDDEIQSHCVDLAIDAHQWVIRALGENVDALGAPAHRDRMLRAIRQGREVPEQWYDELRDLDDLIAASMVSRRFDASRVALGELRSEHAGAEGSALRAMVFERRCDELVLLLAGEPSRQRLRDATYAHAQVTGHPALPEPAEPRTGANRPSAVSAPTVR
ncbi:hypothetical protein [Nocardia cyriacigeorgica]|uniref:hypothetical protein n=1 Tax=Nocardia cyriacigeorgica TaxID=135487 RepID=UPI002458CE14|nr:hypothetical protein [Nocardia cyriacigeorgica]BDT85725.1 hypothetical protein FMUAM8_14890 [Nocardia cyriacigeorgica]